MHSNPSPGVAAAIAAIDTFLTELRAQLATRRRPARPAPARRRARRARRRLLRHLGRPSRN